MYRNCWTIPIVLVATIFSAPPAFGQGLQTGVITGAVTTPDGLSLPAATVTVASPALQGMRVSVTDVNGQYVIRGLPPGEYTVTIEMSGMATRTERTVVALGRTTTLDAEMAIASLQEKVEVRASSSPIVTNTATGSNFRKAEIDVLPTGRTPQLVAEMAPNLTDNTPNTGQLQIAGAMAFDNVFLVDGVDINDNLFGNANNLFIEDAVEETQVLTSGISSEYGRFSGGVVNIVTKRGGNEFSGSYRMNLQNPRWTEETPFETVERRDDLQLIHEATLGGPILRDRLWFFASGRSENSSTPFNFVETRIPGTAGVKDRRVEGKLTATVFRNHTIQGSFLNNETTQSGNRGLSASAMEPSVLVTRKLPQKIGVLNWNGVLSPRLFASAQYSRKYFGFRGAGGTSRDLHDSPFRSRGAGLPSSRLWNAPYFDATDPEDRNNDQVTASLSYFLSTRRTGSHDVKGGWERYNSAYTGGNSQTSTGYVFYTPYVVNGGVPLFGSNGKIVPRWENGTTLLYNWLATRGAHIDITTNSYYLHDRWALTKALTLDLGARYERVRSEATGDVIGADTDTWVPRLGATYDLTGNGKWVLQATYAHYAGKYGEAQFVGNTDVGNPSLVIYPYTGPDGEGLDFAPGFNLSNYGDPILGSFPTANVRFDEGLHSAVNKEFTVSTGGEVGRRGYVKATYVQRRITGAIEDFINRTTGTTDIVRNGIDYGINDNAIFRNAGDDFYRDYKALVLQGRQRLSDRLMVDTSYTLQIRDHGNYEGENANQPGVVSLYGDYPQVFNEARHWPVGRLDDFQRHKLRVLTTYNQGLGRFGAADLGVIWRYNSGLTYSLRTVNADLSETQLQTAAALGYANEPGGGSQTIYYGARGTEQFPGYGLLDLAVNYSIPVWKTVRPYVRLEVLNLANNHKQIGYDTTLIPNWEGPVDALGIPTTYTRGSNFGQPTSELNYPQWRSGLTGGRSFLVATGFRF